MFEWVALLREKKKNARAHSPVGNRSQSLLLRRLRSFQRALALSGSLSRYGIFIRSNDKLQANWSPAAPLFVCSVSFRKLLIEKETNTRDRIEIFEIILQSRIHIHVYSF